MSRHSSKKMKSCGGEGSEFTLRLLSNKLRPMLTEKSSSKLYVVLLCWCHRRDGLRAGRGHSVSARGGAERGRCSLEKAGGEAGDDDADSPVRGQSDALPSATSALQGNPSTPVSTQRVFLHLSDSGISHVSVQLGGGQVQGLVDALQSLGLTEGVRLLRNAELQDNKHSTGNTHMYIHTGLLRFEAQFISRW